MFWCISCGKQGIPLMRSSSKRHAPGHRKKLYCVNCRTVINHIETRGPEEARQFREDFQAGKYKEEAQESIRYTKEHKND